jgi:hypothetical protein
VIGVEVYYKEVTGGGDFSATEKIPFNARHISFVHIAGAGIGEISFDGTSAHAKVSPQPRDSSTHPVELAFLNTEGVSKYAIKGATATVAVRAWR